MRLGKAICTAAFYMAFALFLGCGGSHFRLNNQPADLTASPDTALLPQLPDGLDEQRSPTTLDSVSIQGNSPFNSQNSIAQGSELLLESGADPWNHTAWAIYQIPETPGDPIDMVSVNVQYLDPDPLDFRPEEGYWVGYSDYAIGSWVMKGPYRSLQARVQVPAEADTASPGGSHYVIVLVCQGNAANVQTAGIGGYGEFGWEEYWMGRPPGRSIGHQCDIQLDPAGVPQIAHFDQQSVEYSYWAPIRISSKSGDEWTTTTIEPEFTSGSSHPHWFRFAIGDDGRRAVLLLFGNALRLYYDSGDGVFSEGLVVDTNVLQVMGAITFVNSLGDPDGALDMVLIAYVKSASGGVQTYYCTYDGVDFSTPEILHPDVTDWCGRIYLAPTSDKQALAAVLDEVADEWFAHVGLYSPGGWDFASVPDWGPLANINDSDSWQPDIAIRQTPDGEYNGCYLDQNGSTLHLAHFSSPAWNSAVQDNLTVDATQRLELGTFSSGRAVVLSRYGENKPMIHWGMPAAGETYSRQYINTEPWAADHCSLAVDQDNNVHIAAGSKLNGELRYFQRPPSGPVEETVVDRGGMTEGFANYAFPVYLGDSLHLFYIDHTHYSLMHAENIGGIWVAENEVIPTQGSAYVIAGAGFLENSNLLYISYVSSIDYAQYILSRAPEDEEWQTKRLNMFKPDLGLVADDETNVAVAGVMRNYFNEEYFALVSGHPQQIGETTQTISAMNEDIAASSPRYLAYNSFNGTWGLALNNMGFSQVHYYMQNAGGDWIGPSVAVNQPNATTAIVLNGLTFRRGDGEARLVVTERDSSALTVGFDIHTAVSGTSIFSYLTTLVELDMTEYSAVFAPICPDSNHEPMVAVNYTSLADPHYIFEFWKASEPDSWEIIHTWESPLLSFSAEVTLNDAGLPALVAAVAGWDPPDAGSLVVYYPW